MTALHLHDRRFLAAGIFAIASLLEVCGCNLLRSGNQANATDITPTGWTAATDTCPGCSPENIAAPMTPGRTDQRTLLERSVVHDRPSVTALLGKDAPAFYDPDMETQPDEGRDEPSTRVILSLDDEPGPWSIPESVFFVYKRVVTADGRARRIPSATAFVISVPDANHRKSVRFLVTARHVVDPEWARCTEKNPRSIDIRLNRRNGGVGYETIPLQNDDLPGFLTSPDSTADVALIPLDRHLIPNLDSYKIFDTPFRLLPTESELRMVHSDQQIMTVGLLNRSSEMSMYPVSHGGILSGNTIEAVTMQCGTTARLTQLHVRLISAAIPQGVSGAPVFTLISRAPGGTRTPVLLGVQAVAWPDRGVAGMTPSAVLRELIQQALLNGKQRMDFSAGTGGRDPAPEFVNAKPKPGA